MNRRLWSLALVFSTGACAYYPKADGERLNDEVYALQTQVSAMQTELADQQKVEKEQRAKLAAISKDVGELTQSARRNDADLGVQLEEALGTVARLRGLIDSFQERITTLEAENSKVREELELRFQGLAEQEKINQARSETEKQKAIEDTKRRERLVAEPEVALRESRAMLGGGKHAEARRLLREMILRHERDRNFKKRYAAEAQFLLGETYFAAEEFQKAAAEYNTVRKKYPSSKWVANALYQLGMCLEKLNLREDAKLFYQKVVKKYRRAAVAKDARARLKQLEK